MGGYEVDIAALRKAAESAVSAGEQAKQVKLGEGAAEIPAGMRGSLSAATAPNLAKAWDARLAAWAGEITNFAADVRATADRYEKDENAAEDDLSILGWLFK